MPLPIRSEEHTSELQSHDNLVCRLLLEKKKPATSGPSPALSGPPPTLPPPPTPAPLGRRGGRADQPPKRGPAEGLTGHTFFFLNGRGTAVPPPGPACPLLPP